MSAPARAALTLEARSVYAGYGEVDVLHDVSITVPPRSVVSVIGANGAGKSTLLKAVYGLVPVRSGSVVVDRDGDRRTVTGMKPHRITALGMNYVPQLANVFPNMSVVENLEVGGVLDRSAAGERMKHLLPLFEELSSRPRQRAGTLSGGQRQMLALARALMTEPSLLLLDEPSAGLSPSAIDRLFDKLREINDQGVAMLLVEQNARRSLAFSDHGYVLETGRNRMEGRGRDLLADESLVELYLGGRRSVSRRT